MPTTVAAVTDAAQLASWHERGFGEPAEERLNGEPHSDDSEGARQGSSARSPPEGAG